MLGEQLIPELCCTNMDRSLAFYVDDLGFKILFQTPEYKFAHLERGPSQIMIEETGATHNWIAGELEYPFGRGVSFKIPTSNVKALYDALKEKGYSFFLPLEEKWYPQAEHMSGNRQFIIQDPDGYLLRMAEDLGNKPVMP